MVCKKPCKYKKPELTYIGLVYCTEITKIESNDQKEETHFQAMGVKPEFEKYIPFPVEVDARLGKLMELVEVDYDEEQISEHFRESMGISEKQGI